MSNAICTHDIEQVIDELKSVRALMKQLKATEEKLIQKIHNFIGENDTIITPDGVELLSWKFTNDIEYFDAKRFQQENPFLYDEFTSIRAGSRRLLLK